MNAEERVKMLEALLRRCEPWLEIAGQMDDEEIEEYDITASLSELRDLRMRVAKAAHP